MQSQSPFCCHLAGGPWWLLACHGAWKLPVTQGKAKQASGAERTVCVEGDTRGHGIETGTRTFPPRTGDLRWGSWHGTGQSLSMCSSDTASWCCARASGDPQPAAGCAAGGGVRVREGGTLAGLPPGCKHSELARLALWGASPFPFCAMMCVACNDLGRGLCVLSQSLRAVWLV